MAEIEGLVRALREGDDAMKLAAAQRLGDLASPYSVWCSNNRVLIAEAGGIAPLVDLLRDKSATAKHFAGRALGYLAHDNGNKVLIAEAGGIPLLVDLLRDGSAGDKEEAAWALGNLARNNDANALAIALAVGLEAFVELAQRGRVTVDGRSVVSNASVPAKRKAALVVAALLGDSVPDSAPRDIRAVIGSYL